MKENVKFCRHAFISPFFLQCTMTLLFNVFGEYCILNGSVLTKRDSNIFYIVKI